MSSKELLSLALIPHIMAIALTLGLHWIPALCIGFLAPFLPIVLSGFSAGFKAGMKESSDPKYTARARNEGDRS